MSTYIKLSDVQKILNIKINDYPKSWTSNFVEGIMEDINSLPSISFEEMIKEIIAKLYKEWDENLKGKNDHTLKKVLLSKIIATEELLAKFTSLPK